MRFVEGGYYEGKWMDGKYEILSCLNYGGSGLYCYNYATEKQQGLRICFHRRQVQWYGHAGEQMWR